MATYLDSAAADQVALTAATRGTILQIATPAGIAVNLTAVDVTFDGVTATAIPVLVTVEQQASAGTGGVALTTNWGPNPADPSYATTVTALKGPWATTQPALSKIQKAWRISPTSGLFYQWPLGQEPVCPASGWFGVTVTAAAIVNATVTLSWSR